jgi:predicted amidohydrolase YtcJ
MDPRLPQVRALAVAGALIAGGVDVREGDSDAVGHERIDLDGRCVLPGFTDAHVHFLDWALERFHPRISFASSFGVEDVAGLHDQAVAPIGLLVL